MKFYNFIQCPILNSSWGCLAVKGKMRSVSIKSNGFGGKMLPLQFCGKRLTYFTFCITVNLQSYELTTALISSFDFRWGKEFETFAGYRFGVEDLQ